MYKRQDWTKKQEDFLRTTYWDTPTFERVKLFNKAFPDTPRSIKSLHRKIEVMGIRSPNKLNKDEKAFITRNYLNMTDVELAERTRFKAGAICKYRVKHNLVKPKVIGLTHTEALAKNRIKNSKDRANRTELLRLIKSELGCSVCGETNPIVLDMHHIDQTTKLYSPSNCPSEATMLKEISKCICICSNHHRLVHAGEITI